MATFMFRKNIFIGKEQGRRRLQHCSVRKILAEENTIPVPGTYDPLSAKILKQAGLGVLYMTGSGVTASLTGMPDVGILTMTETVTYPGTLLHI